MKIIFGILASLNESYSDFKTIWIKNIKSFKSSSYKDYIDFYFIYNEREKIVEKEEDNLIEMGESGEFYNYYYKYDESHSLMDSFLYRSVSLMEYLKKGDKLGDFFIRTNLSTLFDLNMLIKWAECLPKTNLFCGTIIAELNSIYTYLSGTNLTLTRDLVDFLVVNKKNLLNESVIKGDDARISSLIIENTDVNILLIKRLDLIEMNYKNGEEDKYLEKSIVLQHCKSLNNIFCYRFKTLDRALDIESMDKLLNTMHLGGFNLINYIENVLIKKYKSMYQQNEELETLTYKTFRIDRNEEIMDKYYNYKNVNIHYSND